MTSIKWTNRKFILSAYGWEKPEDVFFFSAVLVNVKTTECKDSKKIPVQCFSVYLLHTRRSVATLRKKCLYCNLPALFLMSQWLVDKIQDNVLPCTKAQNVFWVLSHCFQIFFSIYSKNIYFTACTSLFCSR